jgi:hypothetical protein
MRRALIVLSACTLALNVSVNGAELKPTPNLAPPNAPKSEYRVGYGRDPFFPNSTDVVVPTANTNVVKPIVVEVPTVPDFVALRGISTTGGRRLAIINHQTVGENEEIVLRRGGAATTVRCVEIKIQSVVVAVGAATKELFLREP